MVVRKSLVDELQSAQEAVERVGGCCLNVAVGLSRLGTPVTLVGLAGHGAGAEAPDFDEAFDAYRLLTVDGWIAVVFTLAAGGMQSDDYMEVTVLRAVASLLDLEVEQALPAAVAR